MKIEDYDNFFLGVGDMEKARSFYQDTLGLSIKFDFRDMGMMAFSVGDNEPAIILKDLKFFPDIKPTIWLKVMSVRDCYDMLKEDINFLTPPFKIHTGWAIEFRDPAGNILGFTDYLQ